MEQNQKSISFTMKDVSERLGVTADLIRVWVREFNVQVERTDGGHRKFSKENLELLMAIKQKIRDQNWSYDNVRAWLNGDTAPLTIPEVKSNLENKVDNLEEKMELLLQINQELVKRLDEQGKMNQQLVKYIEEKLEHRDRHLMETVRQMHENTQLQIAAAQEQKKRWWKLGRG